MLQSCAVCCSVLHCVAECMSDMIKQVMSHHVTHVTHVTDVTDVTDCCTRSDS